MSEFHATSSAGRKEANMAQWDQFHVAVAKQDQAREVWCMPQQENFFTNETQMLYSGLKYVKEVVGRGI